MGCGSTDKGKGVGRPLHMHKVVDVVMTQDKKSSLIWIGRAEQSEEDPIQETSYS